MSIEKTLLPITKEIIKSFKLVARIHIEDPGSLNSELLIIFEEIGFSLDRTIPKTLIRQLNRILQQIAEIYTSTTNLFEKDDLLTINNLEELIENASTLVRLTEDISKLNLPIEELDGSSSTPNELGQIIIEYLLIEHLSRYFPRLYFFLLAIGLLIEGEPYAKTFSERTSRLDLTGIFKFILNPVDGLIAKYQWPEDFKYYEMFFYFGMLVESFGLPAKLVSADDTVKQIVNQIDAELNDAQLRLPFVERNLDSGEIESGLSLYPLRFFEEKKVGLLLFPYGSATGSDKFDLGNGWLINYKVQGDLSGAFFITIDHQNVTSHQLDTLADTAERLTLSAEIQKRIPSENKNTLFEVDNLAKLQIGDISSKILLRLSESSTQFAVELFISDCELTFKNSNTDSFISLLLPEDGFAVTFSTGIGWSSTNGIYFLGSATPEISFDINQDVLGLLNIKFLDLGLELSESDLSFLGSTDIEFSLGPFNGSIQAIGLDLNLKLPGLGNGSGIALFPEFKPPTGLSLGIDAGAISGGGFLELDHAKGRYAGILQLKIFDIGLTAVGILDTKSTNGTPLPSPGFSFLIIITFDLPPIQLGLGFILTGVGGLFGIHRTIDSKALQSGVKTGAIDSIMFPEDPLSNMPQIISDVGSVFPPKPNRFTFGPMIELGWGGASSILEAELAIILEFHTRPASLKKIIILGQLHMILPTKKAAIIELHLDAVGIIDFEKKSISLDASLYDSRVAAFSVYGDMAFRLSWGNNPIFLLSIGGYNPHFSPPSSFPTNLRRATIALGLNKNPRITIKAYLAITSNTIQFGAKAELYAASGDFNIYGKLAFDALMILKPLRFRFDYNLEFALRKGRKNIAGIRLVGTLIGPKPFTIRGEACISILFVDICIGFSITIGKRQRIDLPPKNVWQEFLNPAILDVGNWNAALPPTVHLGVTFYQLESDVNQLLVHPMGSITFHQKVVPLNRKIDRFGAFKLVDDHNVDKFELEGVQIGDNLPQDDLEFIQDYFAIAQYKFLLDSQKLTRPSFEKMDAGFTIGNSKIENADAAHHTSVEVEYETCLIDENDTRIEIPPSEMPFTFNELNAMTMRGAKGNSPLLKVGQLKFLNDYQDDLPTFRIEPEEYTIFPTTINEQFEDYFENLPPTTSKHESFLKLHDFLIRHPLISDNFWVTPKYELDLFNE